MDATSSAIKTGTSTVGITYDGGVVVGADHRATMGHFIANKSVQKLFRISDNIALTTAGLVGHAQSLSRVLAAELKLFELKRDMPMTVKGAATFTANILSGRPHYVQLLIVGVDPPVLAYTVSIPPVALSQTHTVQLALEVPTCTVYSKTNSKQACPRIKHYHCC